MNSYLKKYKRKIEICQECVFGDNCEDGFTDYSACPYFIDGDIYWEEMSYRKYSDGSLSWNYCFYSDGEY